MNLPQTFAHVYSILGLALSSPSREVLVKALAPSKQTLTYGAVWLNRVGNPHREGNLPAIQHNGPDMECSYYLINGDFRRPSGEATQVIRHIKEDHTIWIWTDKGGVHHSLDRPAIVHSDGRREWLQHGLLHRVGGPAIERADGSGEWFVDGDLALAQ